MYYTRYSSDGYYVPPLPPKFPWLQYACITLLAVFVSYEAKAYMGEINDNSPDYIIFDDAAQIVDASGITENDFVEISSLEELSSKRELLIKGEYAFIRFDGDILKTEPMLFSKIWIISTTMGFYICSSQPNGFVVRHGTRFEDMVTKPNKINARIYAIVQKTENEQIYKMEKLGISVTPIVATEKENNTKLINKYSIIKIIQSNKFSLILAAILIIQQFVLRFFIKKLAQMPTVMTLECYTVFLYVLCQTITKIIAQNISLGFIITRIIIVAVAIAGLYTVNIYKNEIYD